jgi:hypothetical protein
MKNTSRNWMAVPGFLMAVALVFGIGSGPLAAMGGEGDDSMGSGPASVYVVHGIPGGDLGLDPALPVDVLVNGALCVLTEFTFGTIEGPLPLEPGMYDFEISLANMDEPCSNDPVISAPGVPFAAGESASVIAFLDADGNPTAAKFTNDVSETSFLRSRLIVQHTAAAGAVDIEIKRRSPFFPPVVVPGVENGQQLAAEQFAGWINVSIFAAGTPIVVFGPAELRLKRFRAYLVYAVGTPSTGSFTLLTKEVMTEIANNGNGFGNGYRPKLWGRR